MLYGYAISPRRISLREIGTEENAVLFNKSRKYRKCAHCWPFWSTYVALSSTATAAIIPAFPTCRRLLCAQCQGVGGQRPPVRSPENWPAAVSLRRTEDKRGSLSHSTI